MPSDLIDVGLQAERTRLAWSRTALSIGAVGALLMHSGLASGSPFGYLPGVFVMFVAVMFWLCGMRRYRMVYAAVRDGRGVADRALVRAAGLLSALPGVITLVTVL
jgi:uncharacterized membrane protein YidH (DUF202 family)